MVSSRQTHALIDWVEQGVSSSSQQESVGSPQMAPHWVIASLTHSVSQTMLQQNPLPGSAHTQSRTPWLSHPPTFPGTQHEPPDMGEPVSSLPVEDPVDDEVSAGASVDPPGVPVPNIVESPGGGGSRAPVPVADAVVVPCVGGPSS